MSVKVILIDASTHKPLPLVIGQHKALADGQLGNTKATLFRADVTTVLESITLVNTDPGAVTINIYVKRDGTNSRRIAPKDLSMTAGSYTAYTDVIILEAGDVIEGDASTADVIDYTLNGMEET